MRECLPSDERQLKREPVIRVRDVRLSYLSELSADRALCLTWKSPFQVQVAEFPRENLQSVARRGFEPLTSSLKGMWSREAAQLRIHWSFRTSRLRNVRQRSGLRKSVRRAAGRLYQDDFDSSLGSTASRACCFSAMRTHSLHGWAPGASRNEEEVRTFPDGPNSQCVPNDQVRVLAAPQTIPPSGFVRWLASRFMVRRNPGCRRHPVRMRHLR